MTTPAPDLQSPADPDSQPSPVMTRAFSVTVTPGSQPPGTARKILKILAGIIVALLPLFLFLFSSTIAGHQRDQDVKQQLVESISTAVSNATSYAQEVGTGEIVHESSPSQPPSSVIQQRFDQAWLGWQQEAELVQLKIDSYFPNLARNELNPAWKSLDPAWRSAVTMVDDLILLSGQVRDGERMQDAINLRNSFSAAHQEFGLNPGQWTALTEEKPGPACYLSNPNRCSAAFKEYFIGAISKVAEDIQSYLHDRLIVVIQSQDTVFQPWICAHKPFCNW